MHDNAVVLSIGPDRSAAITTQTTNGVNSQEFGFTPYSSDTHCKSYFVSSSGSFIYGDFFSSLFDINATAFAIFR